MLPIIKKQYSSQKILLIFFMIEAVCLIPFLIGNMAVVHQKNKNPKRTSNQRVSPWHNSASTEFRLTILSVWLLEFLTEVCFSSDLLMPLHRILHQISFHSWWLAPHWWYHHALNTHLLRVHDTVVFWYPRAPW